HLAVIGGQLCEQLQAVQLDVLAVVFSQLAGRGNDQALAGYPGGTSAFGEVIDGSHHTGSESESSKTATSLRRPPFKTVAVFDDSWRSSTPSCHTQPSFIPTLTASTPRDFLARSMVRQAYPAPLASALTCFTGTGPTARRSSRKCSASSCSLRCSSPALSTSARISRALPSILSPHSTRVVSIPSPTVQGSITYPTPPWSSAMLDF